MGSVVNFEAAQRSRLAFIVGRRWGKPRASLAFIRAMARPPLPPRSFLDAQGLGVAATRGKISFEHLRPEPPDLDPLRRAIQRAAKAERKPQY